MPQIFSPSKGVDSASYGVFSATLLGKVEVKIHFPDGSCWPVPMSPNAKRVQLLAYLAWQRGQPVYRRTIEQRLFRHGLPEGSGTQKHLQDVFGAHTRLLRRDMREALASARAERGEALLPLECDPLTNTRGGYWTLSACWLPTDLEIVQGYARFMDDTRAQGGPAGGIADEIKTACDALIAAYPADFLQEMIRTYPEEFQPIETSWVREPSTFYRDCYLTALWYAWEYEWQHWQSSAQGQWEHTERALHYYWQYALSACQSPLDSKLDFAQNGMPFGQSERVLMSERALRRCLVLYQARGQREAFEACYHQYSVQMDQLSQQRWRPARETLQVIQSVHW